MNLYVSNIAAAVQSAELQQIFAGMGQVLYARLADDLPDKKQGTGYAFVYVPSEDRARTAVATLNGKLLKGAKLAVTPMSERPGVVGSTLKSG